MDMHAAASTALDPELAFFQPGGEDRIRPRPPSARTRHPLHPFLTPACRVSRLPAAPRQRPRGGGFRRRHRHRVDKSRPGRHSRPPMPSGNVGICRLDRPVDISVGKCRARAAGDDGGRMHARVLHMGGREARGVSLVWAGRCARQRKGAPKPPAPPLLHYGKYGIGRVPGQDQFSFFRSFFAVSRVSIRPPHRHARNKSIAVRFRISDTGSAPMSETVSAPVVTPDLIRGPGKPGEGGACGSGPRIKSGVTAGGERTAEAGGPRSVSRSGGRAGNPPLPTPCTGSNPS